MIIDMYISIECNVHNINKTEQHVTDYKAVYILYTSCIYRRTGFNCVV